MISKRLDLKYIFLFIFISASIVLSLIFSAQILAGLKLLFSLPFLNLYVGVFAAIVTITHKIKNKEIKFSSTMSFNEFKIPFENILSFISNPITIVCSISLAKGIFLRYYENIQYFQFFSNLEIIFIGIVTAYLLFISIMELIKNIKEIFLRIEEAIPKQESQK